MNYIRNKIELLSEGVLGNIDILTVCEMSTPASRFVIQRFVALFRLERGGMFVYVHEVIPSNLRNIFYVSSDTECSEIEINLRRTKWLLICSYIAHKNNILII